MWPNPHFPEDLFAFTEEILKGKLHLLCSENQEKYEVENIPVVREKSKRVWN